MLKFASYKKNGTKQMNSCLDAILVATIGIVIFTVTLIMFCIFIRKAFAFYIEYKYKERKPLTETYYHEQD